MGELRTEPSMEEILASIKRIIADDGLAPNGRGRARVQAAEMPAAAPEPVLELTETVAPPAAEAPPAVAIEPPPSMIAPEPPVAAPPSTESPAPEPIAAQTMPPPPAPPIDPPAPPAASLVSDDATSASRQALSHLSTMMLRTPGTENTLDGLVREMLKPLLKEWLDQRLPDLVETLVAREIARITGKAL